MSYQIDGNHAVIGAERFDVGDLLRILADLPDSGERVTSAADDILRRDYYNGVRGITSSIIDAIKDGEITDSDELTERIDQECDGSYWTIYTYANFRVLLYSDNESAYADEFGEDGLVKDGNVNWSALAYCALRADVVEQLGAEDIDLNNPCGDCSECCTSLDKWRESGKCEDCEATDDTREGAQS